MCEYFYEIRIGYRNVIFNAVKGVDKIGQTNINAPVFEFAQKQS